ncbi:Malonyl-[acyl-carrier protein] O-methyltransferase [Trichinella spiralis]|uniref:Malonyl-[acyl-carrier protein] O-methyltransferase n=1 Tax=Trichinella spiralis TaxID=6334 RepID=A0ABR3KJ47_TRISP
MSSLFDVRNSEAPTVRFSRTVIQKSFSISTALHIERCLDQAAEGDSCNLMERRLPSHSLKYDVLEG